MKLAFAIASIAALQQPSIARADCAFGSNYTRYFNSSGYCSSFEVAVGMITQSSASSTTSSGDTNVTTYDEVRDMAIWKVGDKDSTVQCYPSISFETVNTHYPNGSTYNEASGDFEIGLDSTVDSVADGVPVTVPGFYFFKGGRFVFWGSWDSSTDDGGNWDITNAEGDITDLCEVLGGGGGGDAAADSSACADFDTLSAAEAACTARHNCAGLTDPNFGSDCVGNRKEHCAEIKACGDCEAEIRAMFDCEHGAKCGMGLGECHDADHVAEEAIDHAGDGDDHHDDVEIMSDGHHDGDGHDDHHSSAAIRGVVAALAISAGSMMLA